MAFRWKNDLNKTDATPEHLFTNRRRVLAGLGFGAGVAGMGALGLGSMPGEAVAQASTEALDPNTWDEITSYCNFYEFGTGKSDPAKNAHMLTTEPWTVQIDGLVEKPGDYALEDILSQMDIEERIYRFRCVEAWSMIVPWSGFELNDLLDMVGVKSEAKYVAFETAYRPEEMPGVRSPIIDWPYVEGLRLDEARHPLTLMATGLYGKPMPNQNGAPIRLVVPWKYGFKSIKSIVKITLTDTQPPTAWNKYSAREYGFYSNVNPTVDHPRWSQATERRIGGGLFAKRVPTLMFNGYEDEVASLYDGMDLRENM